MKRDGALALIFVNTSSDGPLADYGDLVVWARREGVLSASEAVRLSEVAARDPAAASAAWGRAAQLHAVLSGLFNALADGEAPRAEDVEVLNWYLGDAEAPRRLRPSDDGFVRSLAESRAEDLGLPLWPVVSSAAEVLVSKRARVARCAREGCGVLFVRRNPGPPRRWCGEACGHKARQLRRYYRTVKPDRLAARKRVAAKVAAERKARASGK